MWHLSSYIPLLLVLGNLIIAYHKHVSNLFSHSIFFFTILGTCMLKVRHKPLLSLSLSHSWKGRSSYKQPGSSSLLIDSQDVINFTMATMYNECPCTVVHNVLLDSLHMHIPNQHFWGSMQHWGKFYTKQLTWIPQDIHGPSWNPCLAFPSSDSWTSTLPLPICLVCT